MNYTLVYDGDCQLCRRWIERLRKWDRQILLEIIPLQAAEIPDRFPSISPEEFAEAMQLVDSSDEGGRERRRLSASLRFCQRDG